MDRLSIKTRLLLVFGLLAASTLLVAVIAAQAPIANLIGVRWFTVNDHIKSIYKKLNVSSRAEAAVLASKQGLV